MNVSTVMEAFDPLLAVSTALRDARNPDLLQAGNSNDFDISDGALAFDAHSPVDISLPGFDYGDFSA